MNLWVENRCHLAPLSCIKRGPLFCKTTNFEEAFALFNGNKWPLLDPEKMQLLLHNWILQQSSYSWKMPSGMFQKLRWMVTAVRGLLIKKVIGAYFGILRQELHSYWPLTKSLAHPSNSMWRLHRNQSHVRTRHHHHAHTLPLHAGKSASGASMEKST